MKRFASIAAALLSILLYIVVFAQDTHTTLPEESAENSEITVFTGTGDLKIDVSKFREPALLRIWAYSGSIFRVNDDGLNIFVTPISTPYYGEYIMNYLVRDISASLSVTARGEWRIEILPLGRASSLNAPGVFMDEGDRVVLLQGELSDFVRIQTISETSDKSSTKVYGYGVEETLLFETWADIDATVKMGEPIQVITVRSAKKWSISVGNSEVISASITPTSTPVPATPTAAPTRRPATTKTPNPTATAAATESPISDATNASDWVNASAERRVAIIHHFYELWQKSTGNGVKISEQEMSLCINAQVASPDTPLTMMILALAANCIK